MNAPLVLRNLFICWMLVGSFSLTAQNVGIGIPNPNEKLQVAGNVKADSLIIFGINLLDGLNQLKLKLEPNKFSWIPPGGSQSFFNFTVTLPDVGCQLLGGQIFSFDICPDESAVTMCKGDSSKVKFKLNAPGAPKIDINGGPGQKFTWSVNGGEKKSNLKAKDETTQDSLLLDWIPGLGQFSFGNGNPSNGLDLVLPIDPDSNAQPMLNLFGAGLFSSHRLDTNGIALYSSEDTLGNQVHMAMIPAVNQIEFFAGNQPGFPPVNAIVHGDLQVIGIKNFKIDHPLDPYNKYLIHSCVESPDMMNIYNGNITTDEQGFAKVQMPEYFDALNRDFRYQLTVIGSFAQAIVKEEIKGNQFVIQTSEPLIKVSWQVTGVRQDRYAEDNRIAVEVDKEPEKRGTLLYPVREGLE